MPVYVIFDKFGLEFCILKERREKKKMTQPRPFGESTQISSVFTIVQ